MTDKLQEISPEERLHRLRDSAANIMAEAVLEMFPEAKIGIGPPIDTGFYYDFTLPRALTPEDLPAIEERMRSRVASDAPFVREEISKDEARTLFAGQPYKLELIDDIAGETVSLYKQGGFVDLCQGPHVERTGQVQAVKLMTVARAYWRGSERNPMLQRIYGALFETEEGLQSPLEPIEEGDRGDHRR